MTPDSLATTHAGRAAHPDRRADEPGLRFDHLRQGRGGDHDAGGFRRRRRLAERRARLYRRGIGSATRSPTICGASIEQAAEPADHRDRPRFPQPAGHSADPGRERALRAAARPRSPSASRGSAATTGPASRRSGACRSSPPPAAARRATLIEGGAGQVDRARLRPAGRELWPGRLLPDALRARAADPADRGISPTLRPLDQLGLIEDNWALGLAGYQSPAVALDIAAAAPANANSKVLERIAGIYAQVNGMFGDDAAAPGPLRPLRQCAAGARAAADRLEPARRTSGRTTRSCAAC